MEGRKYSSNVEAFNYRSQLLKMPSRNNEFNDNIDPESENISQKDKIFSKNEQKVNEDEKLKEYSRKMIENIENSSSSESTKVKILS